MRYGSSTFDDLFSNRIVVTWIFKTLLFYLFLFLLTLRYTNRRSSSSFFFFFFLSLLLFLLLHPHHLSLIGRSLFYSTTWSFLFLLTHLLSYSSMTSCASSSYEVRTVRVETKTFLDLLLHLGTKFRCNVITERIDTCADRTLVSEIS